MDEMMCGGVLIRVGVEPDSLLSLFLIVSYFMKFIWRILLPIHDLLYLLTWLFVFKILICKLLSKSINRRSVLYKVILVFLSIQSCTCVSVLDSTVNLWIVLPFVIHFLLINNLFSIVFLLIYIYALCRQTYFDHWNSWRHVIQSRLLTRCIKPFSLNLHLYLCLLFALFQFWWSFRRKFLKWGVHKISTF